MKNIPPQQLRIASDEPNSAEDMPSAQDGFIHIPVLLEDVVRLLAPKPGETYLDLTAGYGGHASRIIDVVGATAVTLVDRDENAIRYLETHGFKEAELIRNDFATAARHLVEAGQQFDMVLMDLGVSSPQLDMSERGFSIQHDGPLDMRMDQSMQRTAAELVNRSSEADLARIIENYGEETKTSARRIARAIRLNRPFKSTAELASVILKTHRGAYQKVHPATRTFQAIRIALNDELAQLEATLHLLPRLLKPGGRVAVISFHSLEDRRVKKYLAEQNGAGYEAELRLLIRKPILGSVSDDNNPRARSATLRAAVKT